MILPERILKRMDPKDRPPGAAGLLAAQAIDKAGTKLEREEQKTFRNWLLLQKSEGRLTFGWSRTDKRTTRELGELDFRVYAPNGLTLHLEFKSARAKPSAEQADEIDTLDRLGHQVYIVATAQEAIEITRQQALVNSIDWH